MMNRSRCIRLCASVAAAMALGLVASAVRSAWTDVNSIDFDVFYQSAVAWRSGGDLYLTHSDALPNLNPPQFIVAFTPLTLVGEQTAIGLWLALNLASLFVAAFIVWRELRLPWSFTTLMVGIAAAGLNIGLLFGLEEGHPVGLFTLCLTAAWASERQHQWKRAAVLLGLLVSVKPFFGCVLLIALCRGQWRSILWSVGTVVAALIGGVGFAGANGFVRWLETGRQVSWFHHPLNASIAGLAARGGWDWQVWALFAIAVLVVTATSIRRSNSLDAEWLACGLLSLLVSPLGWVYYLPLLAGPFAATAMRRPIVLLAGSGFLWPVPFAMALAPSAPWAAVTTVSMTSWSLIALWCAAVNVLTRDDRMSTTIGGSLGDAKPAEGIANSPWVSDHRAA